MIFGNIHLHIVYGAPIALQASIARCVGHLDRLKQFSARRLEILSRFRYNRLFATSIWPLREHLNFLEEISGRRSDAKVDVESGRRSAVVMPAIKEPCKQEACNIQSCLTKNAFNPERCLDVILKLQKCCDHCDNKSTHCASVKPLLQQITKKASQHKAPQ